MAGRAGHWRRLLLLVGVLTLALSLLAMHQLAFDHTLAVPPTHTGHHADHKAVAKAGQPHGVGAGLEQLALAVVSEDDGCTAGCSADQMSVAACLLALTLMVLCWRLAPPRQHPLPAVSLSRAPAPLPRVSHRRAALSLAELSIRRT
jgi:hypothetical protein